MSVGDWQQAFLGSPEATFFHGPAWSLAWQDYTDGALRPSPRRVDLRSGRTAFLGVTVERLRLGRSLHHLSPAGAYGGWVAGDPLSLDDVREIESAILRLGSVVWRVCPNQASALQLTAGGPGGLTHLIDLSRGAEVAQASWTDSARRRVRRALRGGVIAGEAAGDDDWREYDRVYRESLKRWGDGASSSYGAGLFSAMRARGGPRVRLWLAKAEHEVVAGAIVLVAGRHAAYWHGASQPDRAPGAANLLHWEIIEALSAEGLTVYDLNPSGGHEGVVRFKETLGAAPAAAPLRLRTPTIEAVARRLVRRPAPRAPSDPRDS